MCEYDELLSGMGACKCSDGDVACRCPRRPRPHARQGTTAPTPQWCSPALPGASASGTPNSPGYALHARPTRECLLYYVHFARSADWQLTRGDWCRGAPGWPSVLPARPLQTSPSAASLPCSLSCYCSGWPTSPSQPTSSAPKTHARFCPPRHDFRRPQPSRTICHPSYICT